MQLQHAWSKLEAAGTALFAISYDDVDTLAAFSEKRGITFPLLSDVGSKTIGELGLLNTHLSEQQAVYGITTRDDQRGVAYPGTFVLDEHGTIIARHFEQGYRVRPTAPLIEEYALGASREVPSLAVSKSASGLGLRAWMDVATYSAYQQIRLQLQLTIAPGVHVYAPPVPAGYTPLQLDIESLEGLLVGNLELPAPRPFSVEGLEEDEFLVLDGQVLATVPLLFTKNLGPTTLRMRLGYQACTATTCFQPVSVPIELTLYGQDLIRD